MDWNEIHKIIGSAAQVEFERSLTAELDVVEGLAVIDAKFLGSRIATKACQRLYQHELNLQFDVEEGGGPGGVAA